MKITKELVHQKIREYEMDAGESFYDGLFFIRSEVFMAWCYGKGYLSKEKYNDFITAWQLNKLEAIDENYFVYNSEGEYGASFALVVEDDWTEEGQKKANLILGEWIEGSDVYTERFIEFMKENGIYE